MSSSEMAPAADVVAVAGLSNAPQILPPERLLQDRIRCEWQAERDGRRWQEPADWMRSACRACGKNGLVEVLNLGEQPPANAFLRVVELDDEEGRFPLSVRLCEACGMVQLGHVVPPELLFRAYSFFTSTSRRMSEHFADLMHDSSSRFVPPGGLIVEIGSNDGTALASVDRRDVRLLGIDPARNISVMAAARGVPTVAEFFSHPLACEVARVAGRASLIVACNVLGHIDDLDDVCRGVEELLAPDGAFVFEVPYLRRLLEHTEFDTIYHEHLSYFRWWNCSVGTGSGWSGWNIFRFTAGRYAAWWCVAAASVLRLRSGCRPKSPPAWRRERRLTDLTQRLRS